jgi:ketosteroid isomerase-like protein
MTPKELVQKGYESFSVGDMATIKSLFHEQAVIKVNGMHKFSGTYHGPDSFINDFLAHIPSHFENFKVEPKLMVAEGEYVFALVRGTAEGMEGDFGHLYKIENGFNSYMISFKAPSEHSVGSDNMYFPLEL